MGTGDPRSLRAILARRTMAMARGLVPVLFFAVILVAVTSPAKAATGGADTVVISLQESDVIASDPCQPNGDESHIFHIDGHCSALCGPQVGTNVSYAGFWQSRLPSKRAFAASAPRHARVEAPEPFPPKIPGHAWSRARRRLEAILPMVSRLFGTVDRFWDL